MIEEERLPENARDLGDYALERMRAMKRNHAVVGDIRGLGLLMGMELVDGKSGERATDLAEEVMYRALAKGLSFKLTMGNILTLTPPLTLTRAGTGHTRYVPDGGGERRVAAGRGEPARGAPDGSDAIAGACTCRRPSRRTEKAR